jgi:predicted HNH restriction endonuclease
MPSNSPEQNVRLQKWFKKNYSDPEWKALRNAQRAQLRRDNKTKAVKHMGSKCYKCEAILPDCCYDFHHKDPTVVNEVPSTVLHCSWKRILEELEKCIMVCANCHRIIHNTDGYVAHTKRG